MKKKKTNNKKNDVKKVTSSELDVKESLKVLLMVIIVIVIITLMTVGAKKLGWFNEHYVQSEPEDAVISYEKILYGRMYNMLDSEYYVLAYDMSENNGISMNSIYNIYVNKETHLPMYQIDLSDKMNEELKNQVGEYGLIKVVNGNEIFRSNVEDNIKLELGI